MIYLILGIVLVTVLLLGGITARLVMAGRECGDARSVILHIPREQAWEVVRDFPALHAAHTRGRPDLVIEQSVLREGDGSDAGSTWRQEGRWGGREYWADLEVTDSEPPHRLSVRLVRDSLGTEHRLLSHRCELRLVSEGPAVTKLTWRLSARVGGIRLPLARKLRPEHMRVRLLDLGLRSVKRAIDVGAPDEQRTIRSTVVSGTFDVATPGAPGSHRRHSPAFPRGGGLQDQS